MASNQITETVRGFGAIHWQGPERFGKCKTAINGECEDCCPRNNCTLCLTWTVYEFGEVKSDAVYVGGQYIGTIDNIRFVGYWTHIYGECWFVVELDDVEYARYPRCPADGEQGQDCTSLGGSIEYTKPNGYVPESGVLSFETLDPIELPRQSGIDGTCGGQFCGDCECTCESMCFRLQPYFPDPYTGGDILDPGSDIPGVDSETCEEFEVVDAEVPISDPCYAGGYIWEATMRLPGQQSTIDLSVSLERDADTGGCILKLASSDGYIDEEASVAVTDCMTLEASFVIQERWLLRVKCQNCSTCFEERLPCCEGFEAVPQLCAYPNGIPYDEECGVPPTKIGLDLIQCLSNDRLKSYRAIIETPALCLGPYSMPVEGDLSGVRQWNQIVFECTPSGGFLSVLRKFTGYGDPDPTIFDTDWITQFESGGLEPTDPGNIQAAVEFCEAPFFYFSGASLYGAWLVDDPEVELGGGGGGSPDGGSPGGGGPGTLSGIAPPDGGGSGGSDPLLSITVTLC